jgi:putative transposase
MLARGFRFKLYPTAEQETLFRQFAGVCRLVYNLALEQRREWWRHFERETGQRLNYVAQARQLTDLRAKFDWIRAVYVSCQQQALRDLDRAFVNFFAGRARYPTPRKRGVNDAFRFPGREVETRRLNAKWSAVRLPKIGWVKFRDTRPVRGEVKNATITGGADGWHVSFACEIEHKAPKNFRPAVGIDRGVTAMLALSTGEMLSVPASLERIARSKRRAQRVLSRRRRGSRRYARQRRRVARLQARAGRIRRDFHHRAALDIAKRFGVAVLEGLRIKTMTASACGTVAVPGRRVRQKAGLNRAILNQGWSGFETILSYKMEERGGRVVKIDPAFTSQTCSACGAVDARSRKSQAIFECVACGHRDHADVNAAKNILRRNTALMRMEGLHRRPWEVRTGEVVALHFENPRPSERGGC